MARLREGALTVLYTIPMPPEILIRHPSTPCACIRRIEVRARRTSGGALALDYAIEGDIADLAIPELGMPRRADGLWRHTCCEAFLMEPGLPGYRELNFAPSGEWAVYRFEAYREGMAAVEPVRPPTIATRRDARRLEMSVGFTLDDFAETASPRLALSAVVEETCGRLSYWALAHPPGRPDFHHADGFVLDLPPFAIA